MHGGGDVGVGATGATTLKGGGTEAAPGGIEDLRNLYKEEEGEE